MYRYVNAQLQEVKELFRAKEAALREAMEGAGADAGALKEMLAAQAAVVADAQVGLALTPGGVSEISYMDHTGCHHLLNRVLTVRNNVVKSANPTRRPR